MNNNLKEVTYNKHNSFVSIKDKKKDKLKSVIKRIHSIKKQNKYFSKISKSHQEILIQAIKDIENFSNKTKNNTFSLEDYVISDISTLEDSKVLKYLVHRYRYEIFPQKKILDDFPPYLQIEPSSICNYRCVFCFETDKTFTNKKNGFMGQMNLDLFKQIIDQAENNVEFISIASRGEPLACNQISEMLQYTSGKFLNLKINTNASLLDEKKSHAILSGGVKTLVFSADAADEKLYSKLRVNGNLKKVLKNIEQFQKIRSSQYSKSKIITRVSGVKFSKEQNFSQMEKFWGDLVDQVAFVEYNPWENCYTKEKNNISKPCSDLWRRMFVWWDGKVNPCDVDYKSLLSVGNFPENSLSELWKSNQYKKLRSDHINRKRSKNNPCASCVVV